MVFQIDTFFPCLPRSWRAFPLKVNRKTVKQLGNNKQKNQVDEMLLLLISVKTINYNNLSIQIVHPNCLLLLAILTQHLITFTKQSFSAYVVYKSCSMCSAVHNSQCTLQSIQYNCYCVACDINENANILTLLCATFVFLGLQCLPWKWVFVSPTYCLLYQVPTTMIIISYTVGAD